MSVPSSIAVIGDLIYPAIGEIYEVGVTVNESSNVCFSSLLKTSYPRENFWGNFKILNGPYESNDVLKPR